MKLKSCTKEEFYEFIKNYPIELEEDVISFSASGPETKVYEDWSLDSRENVVASCLIHPDDNWSESDFEILDRE